jgi:hypothetical protein
MKITSKISLFCEKKLSEVIRSVPPLAGSTPTLFNDATESNSAFDAQPISKYLEDNPPDIEIK